MAKLKLRKPNTIPLTDVAKRARAKGVGGKKSKARAQGGNANGGIPFSGQSGGGGNSDVPF